MGQVIDFQKRRPRDGAGSFGPRPTPASWPSLSFAYADSLLAPSMSLWRSMIASYAGLWLAPFGLEVRVADRAETPAAQARITSGG